MTNITCITLSAKSFQRFDLPTGIEYINYVSHFDSLEGLHKAQIESIKQVKTKYFLFVDSDDPFPTGVRSPSNAAVLIGNEFIRTFKGKRIIHAHLIDRSNYPEEVLLGMSTAIHKPEAHTEPAQAIVEHFPEGNYHTNWMLYVTMLKVGGYEHDKQFVYHWNRSMNSGLHQKTNGSGKITKDWMNNDMPGVIEQIKGMNVL